MVFVNIFKPWSKTHEIPSEKGWVSNVYNGRPLLGQDRNVKNDRLDVGLVRSKVTYVLPRPTKHLPTDCRTFVYLSVGLCILFEYTRYRVVNWKSQTTVMTIANVPWILNKYENRLFSNQTLIYKSNKYIIKIQGGYELFGETVK